MDVSTCERTIGALEQSTIYLYIIRALQLSITLWNGPDNRRCSLPYETKVSPSRTHSVIVSKTRRINNMEAPLVCLIDSLYSSTFWGRNSWESFLVNETFDTKQSLPCQKATLEVPIKKALASRVSSPSPSSSSTTSRSRPCWTGGERPGSLLHMLAVVLCHQLKTTMTKKPGALFRSIKTTKRQNYGCDRPG